MNALSAMLVTVGGFFRSPDRGVTAVEYGIMVGSIAAVIVVAVTLLGRQVNGLFESFLTEMGWK